MAASQTCASQTLAAQTFAAQTFAAQTFESQTFASQALAFPTLASQTFASPACASSPQESPSATPTARPSATPPATSDAVAAQSLRSFEFADQAVAEVFSVMLNFQTEAIAVAAPRPGPAASQTASQTAAADADDQATAALKIADQKTAIVGFSGAMRGSCQICMDSPAARAIASAMLGGAVEDQGEDVSGSIDDAIGELCNMLAGGWKDRITDLSARCFLSPPTVISGRSYRVHMTRPSIKFLRTYRFDQHLLHLTLQREDPDIL